MPNTDNSHNKPEDIKLTKLLKEAYQGKIQCRKAILKIDQIKPYSDFKPEISPNYRAIFLKKYLNVNPPKLFVYQNPKYKHFVMSKDYLAYYMYKEVEAPTAVCIIVGDFQDNESITTGPEFVLQPTDIK